MKNAPKKGTYLRHFAHPLLHPTFGYYFCRKRKLIPIHSNASWIVKTWISSKFKKSFVPTNLSNKFVRILNLEKVSKKWTIGLTNHVSILFTMSTNGRFKFGKKTSKTSNIFLGQSTSSIALNLVGFPYCGERIRYLCRTSMKIMQPIFFSIFIILIF